MLEQQIYDLMYDIRDKAYSLEMRNHFHGQIRIPLVREDGRSVFGFSFGKDYRPLINAIDYVSRVCDGIEGDDYVVEKFLSTPPPENGFSLENLMKSYEGQGVEIRNDDLSLEQFDTEFNFDLEEDEKRIEIEKDEIADYKPCDSDFKASLKDIGDFDVYARQLFDLSEMYVFQNGEEIENGLSFMLNDILCYSAANNQNPKNYFYLSKSYKNMSQIDLENKIPHLRKSWYMARSALYGSDLDSFGSKFIEDILDQELYVGYLLLSDLKGENTSTLKKEMKHDIGSALRVSASLKGYTKIGVLNTLLDEISVNLCTGNYFEGLHQLARLFEERIKLIDEINHFPENLEDINSDLRRIEIEDKLDVLKSELTRRNFSDN